MRTIAILTSGGDSPGMNGAIRAAVKVASASGIRVIGVEEGYEGLIEGRFRELTQKGHSENASFSPTAEADGCSAMGGTILGSARCARFHTSEGRAQAIKQLAGIDGLIVVGGNGSLAGAHLLAREGATQVIGIPASIDNDIGCTSTAIGVDTALNTIVQACDRISDTARAHRRAFVVEVMGRQCGYLAMASAVAAGADAVLFREQRRDEAAVVGAVATLIREAFSRRDKRRVLIVKAEGVEIPCTRLVRRVEELVRDSLPGVEIRAVVLGHLVRGGSPSFQDRMVAARLAKAAVQALTDGATDEMLAWNAVIDGGTATADPAVKRFPLDLVLTETERLIDGTSPVTRRRVQLMEMVEGVLPL